MTKWLFLFLVSITFLQADFAPRPPYKKIPVEIECPFDDWMVDISAPYFDTWGSLGITANMLTIIGGIIQLIAVYFLCRRWGIVAGLLWLFGYYFDAIDGSYARYHHIASAYGDILDHGRDWVCTFVLFAAIIKCYGWRTFDTCFWVASLLMLGLFMGAQEQYVLSIRGGHTSLMLTPISWAFQNLGLGPVTHLEGWLKWFGAGNINAAISIYLAILPHRKQK